MTNSNIHANPSFLDVVRGNLSFSYYRALKKLMGSAFDWHGNTTDKIKKAFTLCPEEQKKELIDAFLKNDSLIEQADTTFSVTRYIGTVAKCLEKTPAYHKYFYESLWQSPLFNRILRSSDTETISNISKYANLPLEKRGEKAKEMASELDLTKKNLFVLSNLSLLLSEDEKIDFNTFLFNSFGLSIESISNGESGTLKQQLRVIFSEAIEQWTDKEIVHPFILEETSEDTFCGPWGGYTKYDHLAIPVEEKAENLRKERNANDLSKLRTLFSNVINDPNIQNTQIRTAAEKGLESCNKALEGIPQNTPIGYKFLNITK